MVYGIIININGICINLDGSEWALDLEKWIIDTITIPIFNQLIMESYQSAIIPLQVLGIFNPIQMV